MLKPSRELEDNADALGLVNLERRRAAGLEKRRDEFRSVFPIVELNLLVAAHYWTSSRAVISSTGMGS